VNEETSGVWITPVYMENCQLNGLSDVRYVIFCAQTVYFSCVELRIEFAQFDRDADGFISQQELMEVMRSLGLKIDTEAVKKIIQRADLDGSSVIVLMVKKVAHTDYRT